jgi:hypothetical protein
VSRPASLAAVSMVAFALTGCGADDETVGSASADRRTASATPSPAATPSARPAGVTVELTVRGDSIKPGPRRVEVERGKPVVFVIDSDRPGGLHVHSSPEKSPEFEKGTSRISITLDRPGVVEVEEHEADVLVAQLEVR